MIGSDAAVSVSFSIVCLRYYLHSLTYLHIVCIFVVLSLFCQSPPTRI